MSQSQIPIEKQVFDKGIYQKVIDTQFHQLLNSNISSETPTFTLDDFFQLYEDIFYEIPKEGDTNSHRYILEKEAKYLGVIVDQDDIQALLNEITTLRQQLLDTQQIITTLNTTTNTTRV
jgi:hypothetical protein